MKRRGDSFGCFVFAFISSLDSVFILVVIIVFVIVFCFDNTICAFVHLHLFIVSSLLVIGSIVWKAKRSRISIGV